MQSLVTEGVVIALPKDTQSDILTVELLVQGYHVHVTADGFYRRATDGNFVLNVAILSNCKPSGNFYRTSKWMMYSEIHPVQHFFFSKFERFMDHIL